MSLTLEDIFKHIQNIKELNNIQINKKELSISDNMIAECFKLFKNDDIIKLHNIDIPIKYLEKTDFINNYNKMILLVIMYGLIEEFRLLSINQQMNYINEYFNSIITIIKSRNGSSKRFYDVNLTSQAKIFKKNIIDKDNYSNYMINFYANYLNINIFIIENNNKIMLYTMNKLFNINKPSIILWHYEKQNYQIISIHNQYVLYNDIIEFDNFLKNNKIGVYNVLTMKNDIEIKDIIFKNDDLIKFGYDNDLEIIYNYLTLPIIKRTSKKSKLFNNSISSLSSTNNNKNNEINNEINNKINNEINNEKEENEEEKEEENKNKIKYNMDLSTEQAIDNVILESYDKKKLKSLTAIELQELLKKQNIPLEYIDEKGKKKKKTKQMIINELMD